MNNIKEIFSVINKKEGLSESEPQLLESDVFEVKEFALNGWTLGETHGLSHWQRVERNGILLSTENGTL